MKQRYTYLFAFLLPLLLFSCEKNLSDMQKYSFIKFYGSYQRDIGVDIEQRTDDNYAILASSVLDTVSKMILILADEAGNQLDVSPLIYAEDYPCTSVDLLELDNGGGFLLGGNITYDLGAFSEHTDLYLVKTDLDGQVLSDSDGNPWVKSFGGSGDDELLYLEKGINGGYVVCGKKENNNQDDMWIILLDEDGNVLEEFQGANQSADDAASSIIRVGQNYLCAVTYDDISLNGSDIEFVLLNDDLSLLDTKVTGSNLEDVAGKLIKFEDSYVLLANRINNSGFNEIVVYQISVSGNKLGIPVEYATKSQAAADIIGEDLIINANGKLCISGSFESNENKDILLLILNDDDFELTQYGGEGNQAGTGICSTSDGGLIMTGSNVVEGNSMIMVLKTNAQGEL